MFRRVFISSLAAAIALLSVAAAAHAKHTFIFAGEGSLVFPMVAGDSLKDPAAVAVGNEGTVYVADADNNRVVAIKDGNTRLVVGDRNGSAGNAIDSTDPKRTLLSNPQGVAVTQNDTLVVSDTDNNRVLEIKPNAVKVLIGSPEGHRGSRLTPNNATDSRLKFPHGVAFDNRTGVVVADKLNHRILAVKDNRVRVVAGSGTGDPKEKNPTKISLNAPESAVATEEGTVVVADTGNHRVVEVTSFGATVIIGSPEGESGTALHRNHPTWSRLNTPSHVAVGHGSLFVTDKENNRVFVLSDPGNLACFANTQREAGNTVAPESALNTQLNRPNGVVVAGDATLIADSGNNRLILVTNDWAYQNSLNKHLTRAQDVSSALVTKLRARQPVTGEMATLQEVISALSILGAASASPPSSSSIPQDGVALSRVASDDAEVRNQEITNTFRRFAASSFLEEVKKVLGDSNVHITVHTNGNS